MDHLDRRRNTEDGTVQTICERILFATDQIYGRGKQAVETAERFACFIENFISYAGRTNIWKPKGKKVLSDTARKVMMDMQRKNP